jgi:hypothetical protein
MALIRVKTRKLSRAIACKAFYDNMEESLSVGIKQTGKFYSYIEGECFSFDIARGGKLLNIDVWKPKQEWTIEKNLLPPEDFSRENVLFLDFRLKVDPASYYTSPEQTILHIRFAEGKVDRFVSPASSLVFELSEHDDLMGLWIVDIEEDYGFRKESAWRKSNRAV